jgi:hypothetical protein
MQMKISEALERLFINQKTIYESLTKCKFELLTPMKNAGDKIPFFVGVNLSIRTWGFGLLVNPFIA